MPEPVWKHLDEGEEYRQLCRMRLAHCVQVREPLVLISQIQRSGGTLLSQLLDGHRQCHTHPHELKIGHPFKWVWPQLDLDRPKSWFNMLREKSARAHVREGYAKDNAAGEVFPFLFSPRLQEIIFEACVAATEIRRERDILDCYFTSYFNAWLDNQNLYVGPKCVVTGFTPRLAQEPGNLERFFDAYPDGMLVSIVRDPRDWFASARVHDDRFADLDEALRLWVGSAQAALDAAERDRHRVVLLGYERLVGDTEATMRELAARIGIEMSQSLLVPTFNGRPIQANSSFGIAGYGVRPERTDSFRQALTADEVDRIEELVGDLYKRATAASCPSRT